MDNIQIGRLIYEKRKELGLTQQELADRLQITNKAVSKWENGDGMPDINLLAPLSAELGLTVDELLSGEEKTPVFENRTNESDVTTSPLIANQSSVSAKDVVIGIFACAIVIGYSLSGLYNLIQTVIYPKLLENYPSSPEYIPLFVYNILFWGLISAVFICKVLRIQDIDVPQAKGFVIAAFVVGLPMIYIQGIDTSTINYGIFFFLLALLLSECHGYKVPHKIFYGLAILATVVFGSLYLYDQVNGFRPSSHTDKLQVYIFVLRLVRALFFYIVYGVFEKCCDEYER